nr:disks large homolog 5-like [Rattus norvegicus]
MWRGVRQTSTPATVLSQKQYKKEEERIIRELQLATQERNELRDRLIYITEGSMNKRPYFKPNPFYEKLKKKEKEVMSLLHNLRTENPDMTENLQELKKEMNFYRNLHSRIILEKTLMKKKLVKLKQENKGVQLDGAVLQKYLFHLNMNDKDGQEKTSTLQTQQHQDRLTACWDTHWCNLLLKASNSTAFAKIHFPNKMDPTRGSGEEKHHWRPESRQTRSLLGVPALDVLTDKNGGSQGVCWGEGRKGQEKCVLLSKEVEGQGGNPSRHEATKRTIYN